MGHIGHWGPLLSVARAPRGTSVRKIPRVSRLTLEPEVVFVSSVFFISVLIFISAVRSETFGFASLTTLALSLLILLSPLLLGSLCGPRLVCLNSVLLVSALGFSPVLLFWLAFSPSSPVSHVGARAIFGGHMPCHSFSVALFCRFDLSLLVRRICL